MSNLTDRELAIKFVETSNPNGPDENLVGDDFSWWTSYHHGRMTFKEIKAMVSDLSMPPMTTEIIGVAGERERIAIEVQGRCQLPDGRRYDNNYCFIIVVRDGLVREVREYCDTKLAADTFQRQDIAGYTQKFTEKS